MSETHDEPSSEGSITRWIGALRHGDDAAAQALWERYFERLVGLARQRLRRVSRKPADADEEDAALSAFDSFCHGLARGRFPRLADRDDLWRLLVVITARKVSAQLDRERALKRGGGWHPLGPGDANSEHDEIAALVGREPTPDFAASVAEELDRLLDRLENDELRQIAIWRMEGYDRDEIADRLGCARRTVARRLDLIRSLWRHDGDSPA